MSMDRTDRIPPAAPSGPRAWLFPFASSALWFPLLTGIGIMILFAMAVVGQAPGFWLLMGLFALCCLNYWIGGRDVLYPAFTYSVVWTLVTAAYCFCPVEIDRIGWITVGVLFAGAASFSAGSFLGNRPLIRARKSGEERISVAGRDHPQARNILFAMGVLMSLLMLAIVVRAAGGIFAITPLFLLKLNSSDSPLADAGGIASFIVGSGGLLPVLALWVLIMEEKRRWKIAVCAVCVALFPLLITQRGLVLLAFCGCITLYLLRRKDRSFLATVKPVGIATAVIVVVLTLMSFTKSWVQSPGGYTLTEGAWMYVAGPLATFNYFLHHREAYADQPAAVFSQILTPLAHLQLIHYRDFMEAEGSRFDRFVYVPFPGNVYTAYKPYYADFGPIGCFAAFGFFGLVEGSLFYHAVRRSRIATFFFAYLASALMFSTFDDFYHSFSRHLNMAVFAVGYFYLMKRIRVRV
jgi:oligosaccharide repeat unit polymerase